MDLISSISGLQQSKILAQVQMNVAKKILDQQKTDGNAAVKLIEAASTNFGKAGDALVAAATGLGGNLDAYG